MPIPSDTPEGHLNNALQVVYGMRHDLVPDMFMRDDDYHTTQADLNGVIARIHAAVTEIARLRQLIPPGTEVVVRRLV